MTCNTAASSKQQQDVSEADQLGRSSHQQSLAPQRGCGRSCASSAHLPHPKDAAAQTQLPTQATVWDIQLFSIPIYSTVQDRTGQDSTAQHRTGQHSTAQHSTAQHSTTTQWVPGWQLAGRWRGGTPPQERQGLGVGLPAAV